MDDPTAQNAPAAPANPEPAVLPTPEMVLSPAAPTIPPPVVPSPPPPKPEVVVQDGEHQSNKALIFVTVLILVVVLGIFGMFVYLKVANAPAKTAPTVNESVTETSQVALPSPTAAAEPTLDEIAVSAESNLNSLDNDLKSVDSGLNDKAGDLSEN